MEQSSTQREHLVIHLRVIDQFGRKPVDDEERVFLPLRLGPFLGEEVGDRAMVELREFCKLKSRKRPLAALDVDQGGSRETHGLGGLFLREATVVACFPEPPSQGDWVK